MADADPERIIALDDALSFMREVRLDPEAGTARRARWRGAGDGAEAEAGAGAEGGVVRLTDADGLIALAEPRPGGLLGAGRRPPGLSD